MASRSGERQFSYEDFCVEDEDGRLEVVVSELQAYVTGLLVAHTGSVVSRIVTDLNSLNHRLKLDVYDPAGFDYVGCSRGPNAKRLRVAIYFTVSAGFEPPHPEEVAPTGEQ